MNTETQTTQTLPVDLNNLANQFPDSNQIHAYAYDAPTQQLFVQFKSNGNRVTYAYQGIAAEEAAAADAAESKGKHFNREWTSAHTAFEKLPGTTQTIVWPDRKMSKTP